MIIVLLHLSTATEGVIASGEGTASCWTTISKSCSPVVNLFSIL